MFALAINFAIIAGYSAYLDRSNVLDQGPPRARSRAALGARLGADRRRHRLPLRRPRASPALALFGVVLLTFQYLLGALLLSQQRAEELELRASQLASFQVAILSALLRTLDLRDQMTARHSAAVARYSREIAAARRLSRGASRSSPTPPASCTTSASSSSPDRILKADVPLTEEDWKQIRRHPYEGARIVSELDGYQPDRRDHPRPPRAHRRPRLPARHPGRRDPRDLAHHLRRRHLRRDDRARLLPRAGQLARGDRGAAPRLRHPARRALRRGLRRDARGPGPRPTATARTRTSRPSWRSTAASRTTSAWRPGAATAASGRRSAQGPTGPTGPTGRPTSQRSRVAQPRKGKNPPGV